MQSSRKACFANFLGLPLSALHGIFISCIESIMVGIIYFLSIYFVKYLHFTVFQAGIMIGFYGVGTMFGGLLGGKLSDKYSSKKILIYGSFLQAIAYFILIYNYSFYAL